MLKESPYSADQIFNAIEALWWFLISFIILLKHKKRHNSWPLAQRKISLLAIISFFCFGLSDLLEILTGAWYEPIGLLIFKALCLMGICWSAWRYLRLKKEGELLN